MEFKREIWLNKLIQKKHNGLVTVITEIRRCSRYIFHNKPQITTNIESDSRFAIIISF